MKNINKKKKIALLGLVALIIGAGLWAYLKLGRPEGLILYGNVDQRQIELAFIDSERIAEVLVEEGDIVRPAQVLARLQTRRLRDRIAVLEAEAAGSEAALLRLENGARPEEIEQARAALAAALAEAAFAEQDYKRFAGIYKTSTGSAVSKQDVDDAKLRLNVAQARLRSEKEALRLVELGPRREDTCRKNSGCMKT